MCSASNMVKVSRLPLLIAACSGLLQAHVGSPDIYLDAKAGAYPLFVTIRTPAVIPGVAELEIRCEGPGVRQIRATPLPIGGAAAQFAPTPDTLTRSAQDSQYFTGSLWMMASGSWQVRITVDGRQGRGEVSVPVPSMAIRIERMDRGLGIVLALLGVFLAGGVIAMAGASVREARLSPGAAADRELRRRGRVAMIVASVIVASLLWFGSSWWSSEESTYAQNIYQPLRMSASLDRTGTLTLVLSDPGWGNRAPVRPGRMRTVLFARKMDDFTPDHGHLMHLYVIRAPGLDQVYHLHPELVGVGKFRLAMPDIEGGRYWLYADVVHENGFPETLVGSIDIPEGLPGRALSGDDASGKTSGWAGSQAGVKTYELPDGYRIEWVGGNGHLRAKSPTEFKFRLLDAQGNAPRDMRLYMGMLGHAAFLKTDGSVFAHIHPTGSVSMAAFMMAQKQIKASSNMPGMEMDSAEMRGAARLPNEVSFPYGLPSAGRYRIFVQVKHGDRIETGVFDAQAE